MCVGVHSCMWVFVSVCMDMGLCRCTHACVFARTRVSVCACVNVVCARARECFYACVFCMHVHTCAWVCSHTFMHTHVHAFGWSLRVCVAEVPRGPLGVPASKLQIQAPSVAQALGCACRPGPRNCSNKPWSVVSTTRRVFFLNTSHVCFERWVH